MKTYCFWEYDEPHSQDPVKMTEDEVLKFYWEYWKTRMDNKFGPDYHLTTKENCIGDWVTVNWAWLKE